LSTPRSGTGAAAAGRTDPCSSGRRFLTTILTTTRPSLPAEDFAEDVQGLAPFTGQVKRPTELPRTCVDATKINWQCERATLLRR
jgi:hypothetical protein